MINLSVIFYTRIKGQVSSSSNGVCILAASDLYIEICVLLLGVDLVIE